MILTEIRLILLLLLTKEIIKLIIIRLWLWAINILSIGLLLHKIKWSLFKSWCVLAINIVIAIITTLFLMDLVEIFFLFPLTRITKNWFLYFGHPIIIKTTFINLELFIILIILEHYAFIIIAMDTTIVPEIIRILVFFLFTFLLLIPNVILIIYFFMLSLWTFSFSKRAVYNFIMHVWRITFIWFQFEYLFIIGFIWNKWIFIPFSFFIIILVNSIANLIYLGWLGLLCVLILWSTGIVIVSKITYLFGF